MTSKIDTHTQHNELANTNLVLPSTSEADDSPTMERDVITERLRQARLSFNVTIKLTIVSAFISLAGILLLFAGKVSEGTVTTAGGLTFNIVSVGLLKLTKESNDRLDRMAKDFNDDN